MGGLQSGGDSGVGARLLGAFLSWLNDRTSDSFVCVTSNNITLLPPEFTRAERFDGIFFVDLPDRQQKDEVWKLYTEHYTPLGLKVGRARPADDNWSPAEIRACCRLATLHAVTLEEAAQYVVPVYDTSREAVDALRQWAAGRCLSADYVGKYDPTRRDVKYVSEYKPPARRRRPADGMN